MDVAVDSAGQDQKARSVDLGGGARQIVGERDDAAVLDADVAFADVGRGGDGPAANDQIKLHSACLRTRQADARFMQFAPIAKRVAKLTLEPA